VFTTAEGWGTFSQKIEGSKQSGKLALTWGKLKLQEISLATNYTADASVYVRGRHVAAKIERKDGNLVARFDRPVELRAGQDLEVRIG
jgi:hypothetical protein